MSNNIKTCNLQISQVLYDFIEKEAARDVGGALHENAAGRSHVHRVKVVAILQLGGVGVAQLTEQPAPRLRRADVAGRARRRAGMIRQFAEAADIHCRAT